MFPHIRVLRPSECPVRRTPHARHSDGAEHSDGSGRADCRHGTAPHRRRARSRRRRRPRLPRRRARRARTTARLGRPPRRSARRHVRRLDRRRRCSAPACRPPTWPIARAPPAVDGRRCRRRRAAPGSARRRGQARRRPAAGSMASPTLLARALRAPWEMRPGSLAAACCRRAASRRHTSPLRSTRCSATPGRPATWIVAVDLDSGRRVVFGRDGSPPATVAEAARASCAVPAYFEPAEIGGRRYVDGGVHSTTNADLVGPERPDLVLVSAPMSAARGAARVGPSTRDPPHRPPVARSGVSQTACAGHPRGRLPARSRRPRGDGRRRPRPGEDAGGVRGRCWRARRAGLERADVRARLAALGDAA